MTAAGAAAVFAAMAARRDEIAFGHLAEGCECRSQLMIEAMLGTGVTPGRAWIVTVPGRPLVVPDPSNPRVRHRWGNHTAPTVTAADAEHGVLVIDPSAPGATGPLTVAEWAAAVRLTDYEVSGPRSQAEMLATFAGRTMAGRDLHGFVLLVPLGVSPVTDIAGSGFWLGVDPPAGATAVARDRMRGYLEAESDVRPGGRAREAES